MDIPDLILTDAAAVWGLRVLYAGAILIVGLWFAFFVSGLVRKQTLKNPRIDTTLGNFIALVIRYAVIVFVIIAVLQKFGVQTASLVAVLGAGALGIGLALQGTLGNVASGIIIALVRPYQIGDFVDLNGKEGTVIDVNLFFTELHSLNDRRVLVPNGQALSNPLVNHTTKGRLRCELAFGVGYDDDLDKVFEVMGQVMAADPRTVKEPPPWFGTTALDDFAVEVTARAWIATEDYLDYRADMMKAIKEAFDREEIDLPYPHAVEISKGEIQLRFPPVKPPPEPGHRVVEPRPGVGPEPATD